MNELKDKLKRTYKGFDQDMKCRAGYKYETDQNFTFEFGQTYRYDGAVEIGNSGFHSCEYPLDTFAYSRPTQSRYAFIEAKGYLENKHDGDTQIASAEVYLKKEAQLPELIDAAIQWILKKADKTIQNNQDRSTISETEQSSVASCSGIGSVAINTGNRSLAKSSGFLGSATNTGERSIAASTYCFSAATNTGGWSAASNTGDGSTATCTGGSSVAVNTGAESIAANSGGGVSSNSGIGSAAISTGCHSVANNSGQESIAANSGDHSSATCSGGFSVAISCGFQSSAEAKGTHSVAVASGDNGRAAAADDCALVLVERDEEFKILSVWAGIAGKNGIKPDTFYILKNGAPIEFKSEE